MNPGVYFDLPPEVYYGDAALSQTVAKAGERSRAHMKAAIDRNDDEPSDAQLVGSLTHHFVLTPNAPLDHLAIKPDGMTFASKEGKAWKKEQIEAGKQIVTGAQIGKSLGIAKAIAAHPDCRAIFANGKPEVSLFGDMPLDWREGDVHPSVRVKARIDWLPIGSNALCDVKTCTDARTGELGDDGFSNHVFKWGYHIQASWYIDLWNLLNPQDRRETFVLIAVEKDPPYAVCPYELSSAGEDGTDGYIELGRKKYRALLDMYYDCVTTGVWPAYPTGIRVLNPPERAFRD